MFVDRDVDRSAVAKRGGTPAARAAAEQAFYDEYGKPPAVRLLRFLEWVGQRLAGLRGRCSSGAYPNCSDCETADDAGANAAR